MKFAKTACSAYTLVEILIALTISLILMLGIAGLFQNVGTSLNDAQSTLLLTAELNTTNLTLQSDLAGINPRVVNQPSRMTEESYVDEGGYFMIVDGMNAPPSKIGAGGTRISNDYVFSTSEPSRALQNWVAEDSANRRLYDPTVGAVDNILAFTATADPATPFRGLVNGTLRESTIAEVIWFVRGNTLYRRVLLVDDGSLGIVNDTYTAAGFYKNNDLSVSRRGSPAQTRPNTLETLKFRENRFGHYAPSDNATTKKNAFPYPLYRDVFEGWYYLRMPTLEETVSEIQSWEAAQQLKPDIPVPSYEPYTIDPYWDIWDAPNNLSKLTTDISQDHHTGSLTTYANAATRHLRAGEDVILNNVISFDVKVWNPYWVPLKNGKLAPPQYIDLGQNTDLVDVDGGLSDVDFSATPDVGFGFTTTGKYGGMEKFVASVTYNGTTIDDITQGTSGSNTDGRRLMHSTYDSWTHEYEQNPDAYAKATSFDDDSNRTGVGLDPNNPNRRDMSFWECPPPYDTPLKSIEITIRCFEPRSKNIRQTRITHSFE